MTSSIPQIFVIDCYYCKAKVAATETGCAEQSGIDSDDGVPYGYKIVVGICNNCKSILVGETEQIGFSNYNCSEDRWTDVVRIFPKPPKTFSSFRIPRTVKESLKEADRSLQAGANIAACVMLGRALEALCRDVLDPSPRRRSLTQATISTPTKTKKKIMLGTGIKILKDREVIDNRLYKWSQQLHAFRNLAAHPEDISISREDVEDLQTFVYAIVEYVYDLTDRYEEFRERVEAREKLKKR